jgi:hypothetical protein
VSLPALLLTGAVLIAVFGVAVYWIVYYTLVFLGYPP